MRLVGVLLLLSPLAYSATIVTQPSDHTVLVGETLELHCEFKDLTEEDMIVWKKGDNMVFLDEQQMDNNDRYDINVEEDEAENKKTVRFTVTRIMTDDDGQFSCGIVDPEQLVIHRVHVNQLPQVHISPDAWPYNVVVGEAVSITCHPRGNPMPTVLWSKQGGSLPKEARIEGNILRFPSVKLVDTGVYRCMAKNKVGEAEATIDMRVNSPHEQTMAEGKPWIQTSAEFVPVKLGKSVNLSCYYDGQPSPVVDWLFNGQRLSLARDNVGKSIRQYAQRLKNMTETILELTDVNTESFGDYKCRATNAYSTESAVIYVSGFAGPPNMTVEGSQLTWHVLSADDIINYRIFYRLPDIMGWDEYHDVPSAKDDQVGINVWSHKAELLSFLEPETKYEIQMQARNSFGFGGMAKEMLRITTPKALGSQTASKEEPSAAPSLLTPSVALFTALLCRFLAL